MKLRHCAQAGVLATIALMAFAPNGAGAMSVSPTHIELKSAGTQSRAQVVVRNDSSAPLPVEAILKKLQVDVDGKSRTTQVSDDFLVFPPQTLIRPGASQVFRITWVGEPLLNKSRSYQLTLAQLPVKLTQPQNKVQVVVAFGVVINVAPPRGRPDLNLVKVGIIRNREGQRNPVITVRNPSRIHALLPDSQIQLSGTGWSRTLSTSFLDQKVGIGLVQPGASRRFVLPVSVPSRVKSLRASVAFNPR